MSETEPRESTRYDTRLHSVDKVATYLTLDAIAKWPQSRDEACFLIAEHLLDGIGKPGHLTLVEASTAEIDADIAWAVTEKIHSAYSIGTDRPHFRNPAEPDSPKVFPKSKEYLKAFVLAFLRGGLQTIRRYLDRGRLYPAEMQKILEEDEKLRNEILAVLHDHFDYVEEKNVKRRESIRSDMERKYGPGGVKYDLPKKKNDPE